MDITNNERKIFSEIQKRLFYMIPQKWDAIYLFASIVGESLKRPRWEMFFYYYPKGILKKNPINVYEIPGLFNIDEETYNELINSLFFDVRKLYEISQREHLDSWTSITITIENAMFKIEYNYDDLEKQKKFDSYERHVIWRYMYLDIDYDVLTKQEKDIIDRYNDCIFLSRKGKEIYTEGMYKQVTHNIIDYAKTVSLETVLALQQASNKAKEEENNKLKKEKKHFSKDMFDSLKSKSKKLKETSKRNKADKIKDDELLTTDKMTENMKDSDDYIDDYYDLGEELLTTEKMISNRNDRNEYLDDFDDNELLTTAKMTKK